MGQWRPDKMPDEPGRSLKECDHAAHWTPPTSPNISRMTRCGYRQRCHAWRPPSIGPQSRAADGSLRFVGPMWRSNMENGSFPYRAVAGAATGSADIRRLTPPRRPALPVRRTKHRKRASSPRKIPRMIAVRLRTERAISFVFASSRQSPPRTHLPAPPVEWHRPSATPGFASARALAAGRRSTAPESHWSRCELGLIQAKDSRPVACLSTPLGIRGGNPDCPGYSGSNSDDCGSDGYPARTTGRRRISACDR